MQRYSDDFFISKLRKEGDMSVYRFARTFGIHQNTVQNRLNDLANRGLINRVSVTPEKFGPKVNEKLSPADPKPEEKARFFSSVINNQKNELPTEELPVIEAEILNFIERKKERVSVGKLAKLLGYNRNIIGRAARHLETKGYLASDKEGSSIFYSRTGIEHKQVVTSMQEMRAMLSIGSLLSIIKNAFTDLESQVNILSAQNEALKNTMENNTKPPIIDEETIRSDERNRVFASLSNIMKLSPGIIAEWYKAGKDR